MKAEIFRKRETACDRFRKFLQNYLRKCLQRNGRVWYINSKQRQLLSVSPLTRIGETVCICR